MSIKDMDVSKGAELVENGVEGSRLRLQSSATAGGSLRSMIDWLCAVGVVALGLAALLITAVNFRAHINLQSQELINLKFSFVVMASALITAVGVVVVTVYVIRSVRREAGLALEVERLRANEKLTDSQRELRHDFDNQLTVIMALLQMGNVQRAVRYLRGVVVGHEAETEHVGELAPILRSFLAQKAEEMVVKKIDVTMRHGPSCQYPSMPAEALTRVVGNLLDNAAEAALADECQPRVTVDVNVCGTTWMFSVWNNGRFIPRDSAQHLFERGFSTKEEEGHGLGLALVHRLVKEYLGTIDFKSDPRHGTTFYVQFPLESDSDAPESLVTSSIAASS